MNMIFTRNLHRLSRLLVLPGFLTIVLLGTQTHAAEVSLISTGTGVWTLTANDLNEVSALDIDMRYDPGKLPNVKVEQGGLLQGAMSVINDQTPGILRAASVTGKQFDRSGTILILRSPLPGAELIPMTLKIRATDKKGQPVPIVVRNNTPLMAPENNLTKTALSSDSNHSGSSGSVTFPSAPPETPEPRIIVENEPPLPPTVQAAPAIPVQTENIPLPEKEFHSQESIIAALVKLGPTATVGALKTIFTSPGKDARVRQTPPVVFADGRSKVSLMLNKSASTNRPSIGVQGCRLAEIEDAGDEGWQIHLHTVAGAWPAKILLLGDNELVEFPLVIVPEIESIPRNLMDNAAIPALDLDQDGQHTPLDDYLLIGNLLATPFP